MTAAAARAEAVADIAAVAEADAAAATGNTTASLVLMHATGQLLGKRQRSDMHLEKVIVALQGGACRRMFTRVALHTMQTFCAANFRRDKLLDT